MMDSKSNVGYKEDAVRMEMLDKLSLAGLVPVIKVEDALDAVPLCRALRDGGLPVAEITFRSSAAEEAIRLVHEELPDVLLGAGTVLTIDQVDRAVAAGAAYIVAPGFNPKIVAHCQSLGVPILPGCSSPTDIEMALEMGIHTVKFFPAEAAGGLKFIKAIAAPYGDVTFVPTGGINEQNVLDYLAFPKVRAVGGSWMVPADAIRSKDFDRITRLTRQAIDVVLGLELRHIGINAGTPERAEQAAELLARITGWALKDGAGSAFVGEGLELLKKPFRGEHGHIALSVNNIERGIWHLERRGFVFDRNTANHQNGRLTSMYLRDEIAGFAVHLLQK